MKYNEPLTKEYYAEQKRLWDEMNSRNKINNASILTNEQRFGIQNPILSKLESITVALKIIEIAKDKAYQRTKMNPECRIQNEKLFPWMKVERYYIRTLDRLIETEGFIDHTANIAYEEDEALIMSEDKWKATDIETGLLIGKDRGFAELYDKVFKMKDIINKRRLTGDYMVFKQQFEMIKNGDFGKIIKIES